MTSQAKEKKKGAASQMTKASGGSSALNSLDKFLKEMKLKDIKPQHLERYKPADLKMISQKSSKVFNLNYYETHPLKRLTRLFTRTSWLRLAEIDPANIDFHSIQNIDLNDNHSVLDHH